MCQACADRVVVRQRQYSQNLDPEKRLALKASHRASVYKYWAKTKSTRSQRLWLSVFAVIGTECACCGETDPIYLTIDHVNNDGAEHRRQSPTRIPYGQAYLQDHKYELQTLCWNCHMAKSYRGGCTRDGHTLKGSGVWGVPKRQVPVAPVPVR